MCRSRLSNVKIAAQAVYPYTRRYADELSLHSGDMVYIYSKDVAETGEEGWWFGAVGARHGLFPANHVKSLSLEVSCDPKVLKDNTPRRALGKEFYSTLAISLDYLLLL